MKLLLFPSFSSLSLRPSFPFAQHSKVQSVQKLAKLCLSLIFLAGAFATNALVYADSTTDWSKACVAGLASSGGRGSSAADAYCRCMSNAADQYEGDSSGLLAVMQAPLEEKVAVYSVQTGVNKQIIGACLQRVEKTAGGLPVEKPAPASVRPRGIWADADVIDAIRSIALNTDQRKVFKTAASEFSDALRTATAKIIRDKLDIKRRLTKKQRVLAKRMDEKVIAVLAEKQVANYEAFRDVFTNKLRSLSTVKPIPSSTNAIYGTKAAN